MDFDHQEADFDHDHAWAPPPPPSYLHTGSAPPPAALLAGSPFVASLSSVARQAPVPARAALRLRPAPAGPHADGGRARQAPPSQPLQHARSLAPPRPAPTLVMSPSMTHPRVYPSPPHVLAKSQTLNARSPPAPFPHDVRATHAAR